MGRGQFRAVRVKAQSNFKNGGEAIELRKEQKWSMWTVLFWWNQIESKQYERTLCIEQAQTMIAMIDASFFDKAPFGKDPPIGMIAANRPPIPSARWKD